MARLHAMLRPLETEAWDWFKAAHLLGRAGFGGTVPEIDAAHQAGLNAAVSRLLDFPDAAADEQHPTDQPDLSSIEGLPRSFREFQELMRGKDEEERRLLRQRMQAAQREALMAMGRWWLSQMVDGPYPLQEKLALLWHGHFTTSAKDERSAWLMWRQNELLRRQAAGNFHEFVRAISRDPAMLDYLNNQQNRKRSPNENYARELMELFTLGIGNYTEQDIKEAARAFTGWHHDGENFVFRPGEHDDGVKTFFGQKGNLDGDDVIAIIFRHPQCSRYIAQRLWTWLAYENPEEWVIDGLAEVLRENRFELRPVLRTILTSKAFYSERAVGTQIKSPVQLVVGTARLLGLDLPNPRMLNNLLEQMGQVPFYPPNVKGWPGGRTWINTSTIFVRYNTCVWLAGGGSPTGAPRRGVNRLAGTMAGPQFDVEPSKDANQLVDAWTRRLIQRPIPPEKRVTLLDALEGRPDREENVRRMVQLVLSMPEYQLC
jgi:uncharacterized protein (DUF1800 family)